MTKTKCLTNEEVVYKGRGHELWKIGEEHLLECGKCAERVNEATQVFVLQQASQNSNTTRPNKMGRTDPAYLQALISP